MKYASSYLMLPKLAQKASWLNLQVGLSAKSYAKIKHAALHHLPLKAVSPIGLIVFLILPVPS
jgi:hypothetical protein